MDRKKYEAMLILIVPAVVKLIAESYAWDEITACNRFYDSRVFACLEREETKLWHLSPLTLFHMFDEEQKTGSFVFPEEA